MLVIDQQNADELHQQALVCLHQGNLYEAEVLIRQALTIREEPDFLVNLGILFADSKRMTEAEASYRRALELGPDHALAHNNLGNLFAETKRLSEAEASYRCALELNPDYAKAHNNLGSILEETKSLPEAEAAYRRALALDPMYVEAHYNLGNTLKSTGRLEEAVNSYKNAIRLKPDFIDVYHNMGSAFRDMGRLKESEICYRLVLQINPDSVDAYSNLGVTLQDMSQFDEAEACFRLALQASPDFAAAHFNLGNTLKDVGRLSEAEASYRRALQLKSDYVDAQSNLLFSLNYSFCTAAQCIEEAQRYGHMAASKVATRFSAWRHSNSSDRLRVGLVSGDLREHPVGHFLETVLINIDTEQIELFAYPTNRQSDDLTTRIKPCFTEWKPLLGLSDEAAARLIHDDGVNVLIDLSGHTAHNRLPVFAWKPAPVQVSWLGYFATTGVAEMDYFIADSLTLQAEEEVNFTEKIWRLPETRLCFTAPGVDVSVSRLPALANGYITFGCFNNLTKMNDAVVALWARVLASVSGSRLFLRAGQLAQQSIRENTIERFAAHGIGIDRLILEGFSPRADYLAAYQRVDITLDPFPFTGGTTSVESLWMGVPVLTLAGDRLVSRQGVGLLTNAGLPDWIAADVEDYVGRAVAYAGDLGGLSALRNGLRQQVLASPIFDASRFARYFEAALHDMWQLRCAQHDEPFLYQSLK